MSETLVWVVGSGGLLGSHLVKVLRGLETAFEVWDPGPNKIPWHDPSSALLELDSCSNRFATAVELDPRPWALIWSAGAGVVGTSAEALATEILYLKRILEHLGQKLGAHPGRVLLASSAGGVYAGNVDQPLTEDSHCMPLSEYGRNKILQENFMLRWAQGLPKISTLIARISNLYGPGQNLGKPQGLLAHISRSMIHRVPVHVYVPLDTLRDYVYVADCAFEMVRALDRLNQSQGDHVMKIFHGGETVTIAGIISAFSRIAKGHPRIICSVSSARVIQPPRLQFRSKVWPDLLAQGRTDLVVGIQRIHNHQLALFRQGHLPPPRVNP